MSFFTVLYFSNTYTRFIINYRIPFQPDLIKHFQCVEWWKFYLQFSVQSCFSVRNQFNVNVPDVTSNHCCWIVRNHFSQSRFSKSRILKLIAIDVFYFWCCIYIGKHFALLTKSFDSDRKKFVLHHQSIFTVAEDFQELIKPILSTKFSVSSINFCVNIFNTLQSENLLKQFIIVGIYFVQLFAYCYDGQFLQDRSFGVEEQFYSRDKDFLMIVARDKFAIKAWFYEADLKFVAFVLNSVFSLLAVLRNLVS